MAQGISSATDEARVQASLQDTTNLQLMRDWRVRLRLAPQAFYLYKDPNNLLLAPLAATDGIIFPYTPTINVAYGANYNSVSPVHTNYKIFQYENSFVDSVTITCDFTAQDTAEANYVLAVIHFLRSVTKMFYGQDFDPKPGTPPPLCYLTGLGEYQFSEHPLAVTNFTYNLPPDVDYIRAGGINLPPDENKAETGDVQKPKKSKGLFDKVVSTLAQGAVKSLGSTAQGLLQASGLMPGGILPKPAFLNTGFNSRIPPGATNPTYVPTKINISISCIPIVSRYDVSNRFSLTDYSNGTIVNGSNNGTGGFW